MNTIALLNALDTDVFVERIGPVFEHASWVAEAVAGQRPFADLDALHEAMMAAVRSRTRAERLAFLRGHPELAGTALRADAVTEESRAEQAGAGLDRLGRDEAERFEHLNQAYRERFGFPFIIAVRNHTRAEILAAFEARLERDPATEMEQALREVGEITRGRLERLVASEAERR